MTEQDNNVLDIEELSYHADFTELHTILTKWHDAKPTKDMQRVLKAFTNVSMYVMLMQQRQRTYDDQLSKFRAAKLRAVERARRVEKEIEELKSKYAIYK